VTNTLPKRCCLCLTIQLLEWCKPAALRGTVAGHMWTKPGPYRTGTRGIVLLGLLGTVTGCHSKTERRTMEPSSVSPASPAKLAEDGKSSIVAICEKESFATAQKGLIVAETGLREDVFLLRDRGSYKPVPYGLDEAQRLVVLLRADAEAAGHSGEQAACIRQFAEHLESLTEPLADAARRDREIDTSAFSQSDKQVQDDLERESNAKVPH
jgi:hypothetical protein